MFCTTCGTRATGAFCATCGARVGEPDVASAAPSDSWSTEYRYDVLVANATVRARIAEATAGATRPMSAEDFLKGAEHAFAMGGVVAPLRFVSNLAVPMFSKLGLKTARAQSQTVARPIGTTIVATLCALARRSQTICGVRQLETGCAIEAIMPSDALAWEGRMNVACRRIDGGTLVEASTNIPGQGIDFGKSRRALDELFVRLASP